MSEDTIHTICLNFNSLLTLSLGYSRVFLTVLKIKSYYFSNLHEQMGLIIDTNCSTDMMSF
jgi:hypothetical protein